MPPGSIEAHQTTVPAAQAASVIAGGISMQLMGDRQYLQPELPQHISRRHQQQQQGSAPRCCQPSATEAQEGLQYEYQQPQLGSIHHHQVWQQQQLPMHPLGRQLQHQQPPLQPLCHDWWHGQSMPAARAAAPLVQHAWYAALPGAYQPPGANPCIPRECTQHDHQQPHLDSPASGAHAMSHTAMSQYGMPYAAELHWAGRDGHSSAPDAAEAAHSDNDCSTTCSPNVLSTQVQQQQQQRMNSKQELCALSPSPKVPKGVIKTYNLKALLS